MILQYPNEILAQECKPVDAEALNTFLPHFKELVKQYESKALGLAAPQTGLSYKLVWVKNFGYMANPKIVSHSGRVGSIESCLSVNDKTFSVERHQTITVLYRDEKFKICRKTFSNELSIIVQQELDHLDGKCLPDTGTDITNSVEIFVNKGDKNAS